MWDNAAAAWDEHADFVDRHTAAATERMLALAQIGPGAAVLDLACGPGGAGIAAVALVGDGGSVVLSDGAPQMVAIALRRAAGHSNVSTAVVDLAAIDLPEKSFDAAICRHGLMFLDDPEAAISSVARILRPGGHFAAATWDRREANPWLGIVLDSVGEQFGIEFPPPGVRGPFSLDDADGLAALFTAGGLEEVHVETVATPMPAASLSEWWERVPGLAGPLAQALAGMEPDVRDAIRDRALAAGAASARETAEGVEFGCSVLVAAGRRAAD